MTDESKAPKATRIAELNDLARKAMGIACRLFQMAGMSALHQRDLSSKDE